MYNANLLWQWQEFALYDSQGYAYYSRWVHILFIMDLRGGRMCVFFTPFLYYYSCAFFVTSFCLSLAVGWLYTGKIYELGLVDFHEIDGPNYWFSRRPVEDAQQVLRSYFSSCIRLFGVSPMGVIVISIGLFYDNRMESRDGIVFWSGCSKF